MTELKPGRLDRAVCYLSGAMEMVADNGVEWRRKFIQLIQHHKLKIDCIDPTDKPGGKDIKIGEEKGFQVDLQKSGKFHELAGYVHRYRRYDLRFVDISDFFVVAISDGVPQWGTANEVYLAEQQHKPIFFICEGGLYNFPRWLFDLVEFDDNGRELNIFDNCECIIQELINLDNGESALSDKWVLVRKPIEEMR